MSPLTKAAKQWASMPRRARREAIAFFLGEAQQSDEWAKEIDSGRTPNHHKQDAAALRAAAVLLRAAQGRRRR